MMDNNDLDQMMESFLADEHVDNGEAFVANVLTTLPPVYKWWWVQDIVQAFGIFVALLIVWKLKFLTPGAFLLLMSVVGEKLQAHNHLFSHNNLMTFGVLGAAIVIYYTYRAVIES